MIVDDTVEYGDTVLLHYRLSAQNGEEFENTFGGEPLQLTIGDETIEPGLENCLRGLSPGHRYTFQLTAEQAFGEPDPEKIGAVPLSAFPKEAPAVEGNLLEFTLPDGSTLAGVVLELTGQHALVDFNHPLSGCPVTFEVEVSKAG